MALSIAHVKRILKEHSKQDKGILDINLNAKLEKQYELSGVVQLVVSQEFIDTIESMGTICNSHDKRIWVFESNFYELILKDN